MWTIAAANKKFKGPLGSYNGLMDVHLSHYFSRPFRRSHLKAAKLITEDGRIVPDCKVKFQNLQYEKKKKFYDMLASAIVQNAMNAEGLWSSEICEHLEDVSKMDLVDKIKAALRKKSGNVLNSSQSMCYSTPINGMTRTKNNDNSKRKTISMSYSAPARYFPAPEIVHQNLPGFRGALSTKFFSPYISPLHSNEFFKQRPQAILQTQISKKRKKRRKDRKNPLGLKIPDSSFETNGKFIKVTAQNKHFNENRCKVSLYYHGHIWPSSCQKYVTEVLIQQQHCGGTLVTIYKGKILPKETLTFVSLRHDGFPFSIIVFLDEIRDLKLSSCCEFRYQIGRRLGGTNGSFSISCIEGGSPCIKCQFREIECSGGAFLEKLKDMDNMSLKKDLNSTFSINQCEYEEFSEKNDIADSSFHEKSEQGQEELNCDASDVEQNIDNDQGVNEVEEILDAAQDLSELDIEENEDEENIPEEEIVASINNNHDNEEVESLYDSESSICSAENVLEKSIEFDTKDDTPNDLEYIESESSDDDGGIQHVTQAAIHAASNGKL